MTTHNDYTLLTELWRQVDVYWQNALAPACQSLGISYVDRVILNSLATYGMMSKTELSKRVHAQHQNLTRSLNRLHESQLISVQEDSADRRVKRLEITPAGVVINNKLNVEINTIWGLLLKNMPQHEIVLFTDLLKKIATK